ncbi:Type IV secretory pathway, VirB9 component [Burkholderiales bacterium]|nr:Type IV secretory pathway, VirB9 component [Burkholderiales bacterium]
MRRALVFAALAATLSQAIADPRIRELGFDAASVVTVPAKAGVTTLVQFGAGEHVQSIGVGQAADCSQAADPWCVSWPANSGFLYVRAKTRASSPLTLAVVTDRHAYSLQFEPLAPTSARPALLRLIYTYPAPKPAAASAAGVEEQGKPVAIATPVVSEGEVIAERMKSAPIPVNANYTIAYGRNSADLAPALVFDDGRFTYLKWPGNREIPAVFEIREDGSEMVANTRMEGDLIVVDRVAHGLTLRSGAAVASLRNESFDPEGSAPFAGTTVPGVERVLRQ